EPPLVIEFPTALRCRVELESPTREAIIPRRQDDALRDFERLKQSLELRRVVELDVLSGVERVIDRRCEQSPAFGPAFIQPGESREEEFVKHLSYVEEVLRARVEFG